MRRAARLLPGLALLAAASVARAAGPADPFAVEPAPDPPRQELPGLDLGAGTRATPLRSDRKYVHTFAGLGAGRGLRFNNPYRLSTVLGDDAESLSLSATYADLSLGAALGDPRGFQHGAVLHLSVATDGIRQEVLSASYLLLHPFQGGWLGLARAGVPVVLEPDLNAGFEIGLGGALLLTAAFGVSAELVGSVFYGAATLEQSVTVIPLLAFQAGLFVDYEVLP